MPIGTHEWSILENREIKASDRVELYTAQVRTIFRDFRPAKLAVKTKPAGLSVQIDGRDIGVTPVAGVELDSGSHQFVVLKGTRRLIEETIELPAGETRELERDFRTGTVRVTTKPSELTIKVDDKTVDLSPARLELEPGQHHIAIFSGSKFLFRRRIRVTPGRSLSLNREFPELLESRIAVPGGEFFMGCNEKVDKECDDDEKPGRTVSVKAFFIDRTEVTVEAYAECVRAGECSSQILILDMDATGVKEVERSILSTV